MDARILERSQPLELPVEEAFAFFADVLPDFFLAPAPVAGAPTATIFSGRSATCTVMCAVRFSTRNARPIGAGRTRFCDGPWFA